MIQSLVTSLKKMTQTGIYVKKSPCDLASLYKATGLKIYTRAKGGQEVPLVWGQRVTALAAAEGRGWRRKVTSDGPSGGLIL
jgi:hypothetical protein